MTTTEERIAWLEQNLRVTTGELVQANDRIEALEAALRVLADPDSDLMASEMEDIAREVLALEQDK